MTHESPHLQRLDRIWIREPVYFITTCTHQRRPWLANDLVMKIAIEEWRTAYERHGWHVGRFVLMPDHVHFFASGGPSAKKLEQCIAKWKEWTSKRILPVLQRPSPLWQPRFFDHLLRSDESRSQKWDYVKNNPVRAGLVAQAADWPFQGSVHFE